MKAGPYVCQNRAPAELDLLTDPIPPKRILCLRRLLYPCISSGGILRGQAERGNINRS